MAATLGANSDLRYWNILPRERFAIAVGTATLERNDFKCHFALARCLSMIFSENRYPLFRIMLWSSHQLGNPAFSSAGVEQPLAQAILPAYGITPWQPAPKPRYRSR